MRPRVVLADDHTLVVDGLRSLLEPHCELVPRVYAQRNNYGRSRCLLRNCTVSGQFLA